MVRGCSSGCSCLVEVRVNVSDPRGIQFALGSCYAVHIKALSIIMKVYTVTKNMQVELIRFRKHYHIYSRLLLRTEEFNASRVFTLG